MSQIQDQVNRMLCRISEATLSKEYVSSNIWQPLSKSIKIPVFSPDH